MYWVVKRRSCFGGEHCYLGTLPPIQEGPWRKHRKEALKFPMRVQAEFFAFYMRAKEWDDAYVVRVVKK